MKLKILFFLLPLLFSSCVDEEYPTADTPQSNFEALWQLMDEHYCFFEYKKQTIGVDWDEVRTRYSRHINPDMTRPQLFEVLCNMVGELRDGHVNISAPFDLGRNWSFREDHPENYNDSIVSIYLGTDYKIASGLKYKVFEDNIGYIRCESFANGIGDGNLSNALTELSTCNGLIIDVRNNGGGNLTNAHKLASAFTNEKRLVGYTTHKTGKHRNEFSRPEAVHIEPFKGVRWQKPVVVLTNRSCYSATNDFVMCMQTFPNVTTMGDTTGGGSGMPFTLEIPSGWSVRYSAVVTYDNQMRHVEFGIQPDIRISMSGADTQHNRDTLIEEARKHLAEQNQQKE